MLKSAVFPYVFPLQAGSGLFCALKQGFHAVLRIPFHALRCMGVNIQRERRRRVSKVFLHDLRAVARLQGIDSERMTKIMKTRFRYADAFHGPLEMLAHGHMGQMASQLIRKHQPGVFPKFPGLQSPFRLYPPLLSECLHHRRRRGQQAGFVVFQRAEEIRSALFLGFEKLLRDGHCPGVEAHVFPAQAEKLPLPQSRQQIDDKQPLERLTVDRIQEGGGLRFVQWLDFWVLHTR